MRDVRIGSLEWAIGTYCAVVGALMLVVPHQFDEVVYAAIREHAPAWGALFALTGCALIAVAALMPRRSVVIAVHFVAGTVVLVIASVATGANDWPITASLVILGAGTLIAPLLPGAVSRTPGDAAAAQSESPGEGNRGLDLLPVLFGLGAVVSGVLLIALPMAFGAPEYELVRSHQGWFGAFFVAAGLAVVYAQLQPSV